MRTVIASVLAAVLSTASFSVATAIAKPSHAKTTKRDSAWVRDCVRERTGPTGGITEPEARKICRAEEPEDSIALAKAQLKVARDKAKLAKARARARKAIEACHQVVVDVCVDNANPDGSTDCEDAALEHQYLTVCGSGTGFATEVK